MKLSNRELIDLHILINKLTTKNVPAEAVLNVLELKDEVEEYIKRYQKAFIQTMLDYDVHSDGNYYNWSEHPQEEEITQKVSGFHTAEVELKRTNCLDDAAVLALTSGLSIGEVTAVRKILKK